jgi:hypothetical protein
MIHYGRTSALLLVSSLLLSGCGDLLGIHACPAIMSPNLVVEVRDALGHPAARGATGFAEHLASGTVTEFFAGIIGDSLRLHASWDRERAGGYTVTVMKPGFRTEQASATVRTGKCGVRTAHVPVTLRRDSLAVQVTPLSFARGGRVPGYAANADVRVAGDTLIIAGQAGSPCDDLEAIAFRRGQFLHVQLQPTELFTPCPMLPPLQQFEARFLLVPGINEVLVTQGYGVFSRLFSGSVSPGQAAGT